MNIEDILQKLTARQLQVLRLQGAGLDNSAQAEALSLHKDTLKRHKAELHKLFETNDLSSPARELRRFIKEHK
jgi:DNA-binding NarL/FixJ family response regulator